MTERLRGKETFSNIQSRTNAERAPFRNRLPADPETRKSSKELALVFIQAPGYHTGPRETIRGIQLVVSANHDVKTLGCQDDLLEIALHVEKPGRGRVLRPLPDRADLILSIPFRLLENKFTFL